MLYSAGRGCSRRIDKILTYLSWSYAGPLKVHETTSTFGTLRYLEGWKTIFYMIPDGDFILAGGRRRWKGPCASKKALDRLSGISWGGTELRP